MASISVESTPNNPKMSSKPSRNIRIVGRIRGFADLENGLLSDRSLPWISVSKTTTAGNDSFDGVVISFRDQSGSCKESIKLDDYYGQHQGNEDMFVKEIKPLVSEAFDGKKSTVIAFGARGSGKTYTIQGLEENPGLAARTMAEVLLMAEKTGNLVSVSFYEVLQDHVYDLLQTDRPEIQVFEDAQGKVKLKGLSQINITSFSQFKKLYFTGLGPRKTQPKVPSELPQMSHKGLVIVISSMAENSTNKQIGKINFVDLAGYEDARRKSSLGITHVESTRINKSLYALLKVLHSLNANETRVPYRESKLTRALQDSLGRKNKVLMITCLNPFFCHDSLHAMISVSRCVAENRVISESTKTIGSVSKQPVNRVISESTKTIGSVSKQPVNRVISESTKKLGSVSKQPVVSSSSKGKIGSVTLKKQINSQSYNFQKDVNNSTIKGRKLFHDEKPMMNTNKENVSLNMASNVQQVPATTDFDATSAVLLKKNMPISVVLTPETEDNSQAEISQLEEGSSKILSNNNSWILPEGEFKVVETSLVTNENGSPPLSSLIEKLSNELKSLHSATPLDIKMPYITTPSNMYLDAMEPMEPIEPMEPMEPMEPKTPVTERSKESWELVQTNYSPMGRFSARSTGMKQHLVDEYLHFLNTANKEELKGLQGIGERRATYILELREESSDPFQTLDDLQNIGLSTKQVKNMMRKMASEIFS